MNLDIPPSDPADNQLNEQIEKLEGQAWFKSLQTLEPTSQGEDLFALGFAAGQRAISPWRASRYSLLSTSVVSSALSIAATVLIMLSTVSSLSTRATQDSVAVTIEKPVEPRASITDVNSRSSEPEAPRALPSESMEPIDLADFLPEYLRHQIHAPLVAANDDADSEKVVSVETSHLRYVAQRRQWLPDTQ